MASRVNSLKSIFENKQKDLIKGDQRVQAGLAATKAVGQRLSTAALVAAGCDHSRNPVLVSLWDAVKDYNAEWKHPSTMNSDQSLHAIANLDFLYQICATYMTSKSMKTLNSGGGPAKRKARYEAFTALIGEVAKEVESFGGKMLSGPANFQEKKRNYWLERLDPEHRAGYHISDKYNTWVRSLSTDTFWVWLQANGATTLPYSNVAGYENPEGAQWQHCYYFDGGLLWKAQDDSPLCTALMRTEFSEKGWAVFVCSLTMPDPGGTLGEYVFSYTHRAGFDHHSSFLGGAPVMAAGEWIVDATGKIRVLTGKSGHYMPKWENLHKFVTRFPDIPGDAIIRPNMLDHKNGTDTIKYYRVSDFRARRLLATPLRRRVVIDAISATAATPTSRLRSIFQEESRKPCPLCCRRNAHSCVTPASRRKNRCEQVFWLWAS